MVNSVDFYREILDNLYDGIFFVDRNGAITYWNHGATKLTGYYDWDVMGRNYCDIFKPLDKNGNNICETSVCPIRYALDATVLTEIEAFVRHKEGHLVPISIRITPVREVDRHFVVAVEIHSQDSPRNTLRQQVEQLREIAMIDSLTGTVNRRYLEMNLQARLKELERYSIPFGILFIDVDHFKGINDTHGHGVGDQVLRMVSATMSNTLRPFDIVGRWGGEEFLALLVNVRHDDLLEVSERVRRMVENSVLTLPDASPLQVTVSIGATAAITCDDTDSLVERADRLMYRSKSGGRNRVTVG